MTYPQFEDITVTAEEAGAPSIDARPLFPVPDHLVFLPLTEEELARDEATEDPLVPVASARITDLSAYWETGMRGTVPESLIRASVKPRLEAAADSLPEGWGFAVFDAYRSLSLQRRLYAAAYADPGLPPGFVAVPSDDPLKPPAHATGGSVDLTLTWQGRPLRLGTAFDAFTADAHRMALEETESPERGLRRALAHALCSVGFVPYHLEWWHFEYGTMRWAALTGNRPLFGQPHAVAS